MVDGSHETVVRAITALLLVGVLVIGLTIVSDYGATWDDRPERMHGLVVMDHFNRLSGGRLFEERLSEYRLETYFNRHYVPTWMLITTPLPYTMLFVVGLSKTLRTSMRPGDDRAEFDSINLVLFLLPLAAVIALRSTLYDGWRHLFFICAPFMVLAMVGLHELLKRVGEIQSPAAYRLSSSVVVGALLATVLSSATFLIRAHPNQNVYFAAKFPYDRPIWELEVDGAPIVGVFACR